MSDNLNHILVFRSNIKTEADKHRISLELDAHPYVKQWTVDLADDDCVLRVISTALKPASVIDIVSRCGYHCEELTD